MIVRGLGQGMNPAIQGYNDSAAWSSLVRTGHRSRERAFSRSKVVIPTFILENRPLTVTSLSASGTRCTLKVASTAGLSEGQEIMIAGAVPAEYNGTALAIHIVDATTLAYDALKAPPSVAGGRIVAKARDVTESDLPHSYRFQVALEVSYVDAMERLTTLRLPYLFAGKPTALYNGPGSNPAGHIVSDWLDHPDIPADAKFGLWTVTENQLGAASPPGTLPVSWTTSSFIDRHEGLLENRPGGRYSGLSFVDNNAAVSQSSIEPFIDGQGGGMQGFWPCQMLIDYARDDRVVAIWGDSIGDGVGEGSIGSGSDGDAMGSVRRNKGYMERAVDETLGLNIAINLSRGADGYKYLGLPGNIDKRLNLLKLANPTHVWWEMVHNDLYLSDGDFRDKARRVFAQIRASLPGVVHVHSLCTPDARAGIVVSAISAKNGIVGVEIADTSQLRDGQKVTISGVAPAGYNGSFPIRIVNATTLTYAPAHLPAEPPTGDHIVCNGQFTTESQQSASAAFSGPHSSRSRKNGMIRTRLPPFDIVSRVFDIGLAAESGYSGRADPETGRWKADGTPFLFTADGTHPNSHGHSMIAAAVPEDFI